MSDLTKDVGIERNTVISDVLGRFPECAEVFARHDMHCSTCMGASMGTVEEGACMHGVDAHALVEELRACVLEKSEDL